MERNGNYNGVRGTKKAWVHQDECLNQQLRVWHRRHADKPTNFSLHDHCPVQAVLTPLSFPLHCHDGASGLPFVISFYSLSFMLLPLRKYQQAFPCCHSVHSLWHFPLKSGGSFQRHTRLFNLLTYSLYIPIATILLVPHTHNPSLSPLLLPWEGGPLDIPPPPPSTSSLCRAFSPSVAKQGSKLGEPIWQTGKSFRDSLRSSWGAHVKTELSICHIWEAHLLNMSTNPESCVQF